MLSRFERITCGRVLIVLGEGEEGGTQLMMFRMGERGKLTTGGFHESDLPFLLRAVRQAYDRVFEREEVERPVPEFGNRIPPALGTRRAYALDRPRPKRTTLPAPRRIP